MTELPAGGLEVAVEVGRIASERGSIDERAAALLAPLHRLVPFQAAWISLLAVDRPGFLTLAIEGYNEDCRSYLYSPAVFDEIELVGLDRAGPPIRMRDLPIPPTQARGWHEFMRPAGFREGLGVGLFAPDGRHVGILGMNTDTAAHPTEAARDLIGLLAPVIAHAVDPLRSIAAVARLVRDAQGGGVLTPTGDLHAVPGLPTHPVLAAGSAVLAVAAQQVADGTRWASFLCPYPEPDAPAGQVRVTVLACPPESPGYLAAIVVVSPPGDLHGLTRRELDILGLVIDGYSNARIAATLFIAERTVATHIEHILVKLDVAGRTPAAVRALRQGLYLPAALQATAPGSGRR